MSGDVIVSVNGAALPATTVELGMAPHDRTLGVHGIATKDLTVMNHGKKRVLGLLAGAREPGLSFDSTTFTTAQHLPHSTSLTLHPIHHYFQVTVGHTGGREVISRTHRRQTLCGQPN